MASAKLTALNARLGAGFASLVQSGASSSTSNAVSAAALSNATAAIAANAAGLGTASNQALFGSNAAAWGSNAGAWGSNAAAWGSNAAYWGSNQAFAVLPPALGATSNLAISASNQAFGTLPPLLGTTSNVALWGSNAVGQMAVVTYPGAGGSNVSTLSGIFRSNVDVAGTLTVRNLTYMYSNITVYAAEEVRSNLVVQNSMTLSNATTASVLTPTVISCPTLLTSNVSASNGGFAQSVVLGGGTPRNLQIFNLNVSAAGSTGNIVINAYDGATLYAIYGQTTMVYFSYGAYIFRFLFGPNANATIRDFNSAMYTSDGGLTWTGWTTAVFGGTVNNTVVFPILELTATTTSINNLGGKVIQVGNSGYMGVGVFTAPLSNTSLSVNGPTTITKYTTGDALFRVENASGDVSGATIQLGSAYGSLASASKTCALINAVPFSSTGGMIQIQTCTIGGVLANALALDDKQNATLYGNLVPSTGSLNINRVSAGHATLRVEAGAVSGTPYNATLDFGSQFTALANSGKSMAQITAFPSTSTGGALGIATCTTGGVLTTAITIDVVQNVATAKNLSVGGALSKVSGTFKIPHPMDSHNKFLIHSFIEGPRADLIYRSKARLAAGQATVDINKQSTGNGSTMMDGTFEALCRDPQVYLQNNETWDKVRGSVTGCVLTIQSENPAADFEVDWMVVAERKDPGMVNWDMTDDNGQLILEHDNPPVDELTAPAP